MHTVSDAYKTDIRKRLRNRSFMKVVVGIVNQGAQNSILSSPENEFLYLSNISHVFTNFALEAYYATAEQNFVQADGKSYFAPADKSEVALEQGAITKALLGTFKVTFGHAYDLVGLTINFGKNYPIDFDIITDTGTYEVRRNNTGNFLVTHSFTDTTTITIKPIKMVGGNDRLRILSFSTGVGIEFDNSNILDTKLKTYCSPISEKLPTIDFVMNASNYDGEYDVENDDSTINYLEMGQNVEVFYGYELDTGTVEWMKAATLMLSSWVADDTELTLSAKDKFSNLTDQYDYGEYFADGITLYDLAEKVFAQANIASSEYVLDTYLKEITVKNPIPVCTFGGALQLIANAGRSSIYENAEGKICIEHSFAALRMPTVTPSANEEHELSTVANIMNTDEKKHYTIAGKNSLPADASVMFAPDSVANKLYTGFISKVQADADGNFSTNPTITLTLSVSYHSYGLRLNFGGNHPKHCIITLYLDDSIVYVLNTDITSNSFKIENEFPDADKFVIVFDKGTPYNNVILDSIVFGLSTDYRLTYGTELTAYQKGKRTELIKNIKQNIYTLANSTDDTPRQIVNETVENTSATTYHKTVEDPSYGYKYTVDGTETTIKASTAHSVDYVVPSGKHEVIIECYEYEIIKKTYTESINLDGNDVEEANFLISDRDNARIVSKWEADYYSDNREYEIPYRGDPRIESNDVLFMDNRYSDNVMIRVIEHDLSFNGALSGTITAKRDTINE